MYFVTLVIIITLISNMSLILMMKTKPSREKQSMFECGFEYLSFLRIPFSIHFYLISMVFLIFDIELILILPFTFTLKMNSTLTISLIFSLFMIIMILGLVYEWNMGIINWLI